MESSHARSRLLSEYFLDVASSQLYLRFNYDSCSKLGIEVGFKVDAGRTDRGNFVGLKVGVDGLIEDGHFLAGAFVGSLFLA
jgi:hypothetical protein